MAPFLCLQSKITQRSGICSSHKSRLNIKPCIRIVLLFSPKVILISFPSMWRWMRKGTITLGMVCMSLNMAEAAGRLPIGKTIKGLTH